MSGEEESPDHHNPTPLLSGQDAVRRHIESSNGIARMMRGPSGDREVAALHVANNVTVPGCSRAEVMEAAYWEVFEGDLTDYER